MKLPLDRIQGLTPERLRGMRRGLMKESLGCDARGELALTPHPLALGSALTHPLVTTDYRESQLEFVTSAHTSVEACLQELIEILGDRSRTPALVASASSSNLD